MLASWKALITVLLATIVTSLPCNTSIAERYPLAEHVIPLYKSTLPYIANYEADITVGSQIVRAILDTGSSNTFFMPQDYQCLDTATHQPISTDLCGYKGTSLAPSSLFEQLPSSHMNASFASGEFVITTEVSSNISFGGINIARQEFGLTRTAATFYQGNVTGLVGLAYSAFSSVYPGDDPSKDIPCKLVVDANAADCNQLLYSTLLSTIFASSLAPPIFSFALGRSNSSAGFMAIGGIPDLTNPLVNATKESASVTVPIEKLPDIEGYTYYLITINGFSYNGAPPGAGSGQYEIDTGTVANIVDKENAQHINALFNPPGWYNETTASYYVQCNATAPQLAVETGGVSFDYNPKDLILSGGEDDVACFSGVQEGIISADSPPILGSVFLRNVLAVFDIGNGQMTFTSRMYYQEE